MSRRTTKQRRAARRRKEPRIYWEIIRLWNLADNCPSVYFISESGLCRLREMVGGARFVPYFTVPK